MNTAEAFMEKLCKVSMCPPEENSDADYIVNNSPIFNEAKKFIIEFGCENVKVAVSVGQKVDETTILAYMEGLPVTSKVYGTITEVNEKYIIGEYLSDADEISKLAEKEIEKLKSLVPKDMMAKSESLQK